MAPEPRDMYKVASVLRRRCKGHTSLWWVILALGALGWASPSLADVIYLHNGDHITGTVRRETQTGIIVRVGRNQEIHIRFEEISEIRRSGETVPVEDAGDRSPGALRDRTVEKALIQRYAQQMEHIYYRLNPGKTRISYQVRRQECDPVRAARQYGLPVSEAPSNKALENMFELTLYCYQNGSTAPWRRTLLFYAKPRSEYIQAVSEDVELANIYLDNPNIPYLLALKDE